MRAHFVALALVPLLLCTLLPVMGPHESSRALAQEQSPHAQVSVEWASEKVDLAELFDAVVDTVNKTFFDQAALNRNNWRERAQALRPLVLDSLSIGDALRQINQLLAEIKASHTALYTPNDYEYYILLDVLGVYLSDSAMRDLMHQRFWGAGPYFPGIGVFTCNVDGRNFVDGVLEGSPAEKAGLKFGDEILSVDGRPYRPIQAFRDKIGATAELMVRRTANAAPERFTVMVIPIRPVQAFSDATEASARIIERNGSRVGYVHVWGLAESNSFVNALHEFDPVTIATRRLCANTLGSCMPKIEELRAITGELPKPVDSLIVDLRGRVGGNIAVAGQLLQQLDGGSYWGGSRARVGVPTVIQMTGSGSASFRGRSGLLIDSHTRSAAEIMAYGYKRSAFGPLFGMRTAGAVLSGATHRMPGDMVLYLAVGEQEIDGHHLEGTGVTPDYLVERPLPYAQGVDPVLEAAADLLSSARAK
jgi:carboxyl-terminal processing protease